MDNPNPQETSSQAATGPADLTKIETFLKAKDDTQRFVGLALLKSVLDNSDQLRQDEATLQGLWGSLSPKFLDRLLRTGSKPSSRNQNAKEMLDLVVSVLHTFAALLPEKAATDGKFLGRIPGLIGAVLYSSEETTRLLLQLLHTLVNSQEGANAFLAVGDIASLTEIAPNHATVLDILAFAWLNGMTVAEDPPSLARKIDNTVQSLVSSFTGTDAVTFLEFLGSFLRNADSRIIPSNPKWLEAVVGYIHNLVTSRPTPEARSAYTNAAASLLQAYPIEAPKLLFANNKKDDKDFPYLLINLLLIDIRSSVPTLLEQLNKPEYPKTSRRLGSAFDVISVFVGYLIQSLEDESSDGLAMSPDSLLKLRKGIPETMSLTIEYLRDRWDASVAGAMGLHPDARPGVTETVTGSHHTLSWDSMQDHVDEDMFILSAIRALALWLREDDNDLLRKESTGLMDMFMDLYESSSHQKLDFRSPIIVALEGVTALKKGREALIQNNGWKVLTSDLLDLFQASSRTPSLTDASRGTDIVRVLFPLVEAETGGVPEQWMDLITAVAACDVVPGEQGEVFTFQAAVLELCCAVLLGVTPGVLRRYSHSIAAIRGIATVLQGKTGPGGELIGDMEDVLIALRGLEVGL